ncbi:MAG: YbaY family lipoprotein [Anaerolineae bacterium]
MVKTILGPFLLLGLVLLTGCGSSNQATVSGTVTYLQRIALQPDAVVTVRIEDVSKADVMSEVIGEQVIHTDGAQVPLPFEVTYDADQIEESHSYSLRVRIEDGEGELLWINDTSVPVITRGNPTQGIEVLVVQVGG